MDFKIRSIEKNGTWFLIDLLEGDKLNGVKWVYKTNLNEHGKIEKYKAQLVGIGCAQEYGVDYSDIFAPVARLDIVRVILALTTQKSLIVYQFDVKSAFLHGELVEDVFVEQLEGYENKEDPHKVYKLKQAH